MMGPHIVLAGLLFISTPEVELVPLEAPPVAGVAVTLRFEKGGLPAPDVPVKATYRQNAHPALTREEALGVTGADGTIDWIPTEAGVVVLEWEGGSRNVSVRYDRVPLAGVAVAILAGVLLLGGAVLRLVREPAAAIGDPGTPRPET